MIIITIILETIINVIVQHFIHQILFLKTLIVKYLKKKI